MNNNPVVHEIAKSDHAPPGSAGAEIQWSNGDVLRIVFGIGLTFMIGIALVWIGAIMAKDQGLLERKPTLAFSLLAGCLEAGALYSGVSFFGLRRHKVSWRAIFGPRMQQHWFWISILYSFLAIVISTVVVIFLSNSQPGSAPNPMIPFLAPHGATWTSFFGILFVAGIAAPITEELFFRGVLFKWLRQHWNFWAAALVSSLIFGLLHGSVVLATAATLIGLLLAYLYEKSGSLWSPIIVHIVNNSVKIILLYMLLSQRIGVSNL